MSEDEKLRLILIMSAIVAALAVHRFAPAQFAEASSKPALVKAARLTLGPFFVRGRPSGVAAAY